MRKLEHSIEELDRYLNFFYNAGSEGIGGNAIPKKDMFVVKELMRERLVECTEYNGEHSMSSTYKITSKGVDYRNTGGFAGEKKREEDIARKEKAEKRKRRNDRLFQVILVLLGAILGWLGYGLLGC
ncbi:MAG: hypothetical protein LBV74_09015 [Tannerella sp.]|jgi:hypothetical protein|nr:hypothetical protein [Tannerella sp.]